MSHTHTHTHNIMNGVILLLLRSFLEHCLIHLDHLLLFMQTRCTQQRRIMGGSNAFSLWHCYCFECEIQHFLLPPGSWSSERVHSVHMLPPHNKVWCYQEHIHKRTHTGLRGRTHSGMFYYWIWNTLHISQPPRLSTTYSTLATN